MDFGELLTAMEEHIFDFARKQFQINNVPDSIQRIIMEAVYSRFQAIAINAMIAAQIRYEGDKDPERVTMSEETVRKTVKAMEDFYSGEGNDADTADCPA